MYDKTITQFYNINPKEFKEELIKDLKKELQTHFAPPAPINKEEYLTRKEAIKILKVSNSTICDWDKNGITKPYRLGNLIRYKRSELEAALIAINK